MRGEVFFQAGQHFRDALLDVFVQGRDDRIDGFVAHGFVACIEVRPYNGVGLDVAQFQFHGDAGEERGSGNFLEIVQTAMQEIISVDVASQHVHSAKMAGSAQLAQQNFLDHVNGRLDPTVILVKPHALAAGAVNDLLFPVDIGSRDPADEQSEGNRVGICGGRHASGNRELIILTGPGSAASSGQHDGQRKHARGDRRRQDRIPNAGGRCAPIKSAIEWAFQ